MKIWTTLIQLFKPISELVDNLHTSDEERLNIKTKLFEIQNKVVSDLIEYEQKLLDARTKVITAEAQGSSLLQRTWRPITMLTFLILVVCDTFGLTEFRLSQEAWALLKLGIGGYVVGRSVEKVAPTIMEVMKRPS